MNWKMLAFYAWHGLSQAVITAGASIAVLDQWPTKFQWLIVIAGALVAGVKGVDGYLREPETQKP